MPNSTNGMRIGDEVKTVDAPIESFKATEFQNGPSGQFYEFWIHCMILILIPWVTVFSMNVMIIKAVSGISAIISLF